MSDKNKINVLEGDIKGHMLKMAIPSMWGMFAITVFNLTDTYFVSKLGTDALAAMGFTFPVVMIIGSVAGGISMGAGSVLARAVGRGDNHKKQRIASDGILLSILMVILVSVVGIFFVEDIFRALGARGKALELVIDYMTIWFAGALFVIVPPVSDSSMRALGDMVRPLVVMLSVAVINVILDPILIFGWFGFPEMGIKGAVLATIISRAIAGGVSLYFTGYHYKLLNYKYESVSELFESWREIIVIGVPNVINRLLPQAIRASMTTLAANTAGVAAVAAIAGGQKIESFATIASMGIGTAIIPIVGQNYGNGKMERVMDTRTLLIRMSIVYGLMLFAITLPFGRLFGSIFSNDPEVIGITATYIRIIMVGTIGLNHYNWISEAFNATGRPLPALIINIVGTLLIILPLLFVGIEFAGFNGMLIGLVLGQIIVGIGAIMISKNRLTSARV